jgi:hypothetical protein
MGARKARGFGRVQLQFIGAGLSAVMPGLVPDIHVLAGK